MDSGALKWNAPAVIPKSKPLGLLFASMRLAREEPVVFSFDNFDQLEDAKYTSSKVCQGHKWWLGLYPWGHNMQAKDDGMASMYFRWEGTRVQPKLKVEYLINVPGGYSDLYTTTFTFGEASCFLPHKLIERSTLLKHLRDGTLSVKVHFEIMVIDADFEILPPIHDGPNRRRAALFKDTDSMDVTFLLKDTNNGYRHVPAHSHILATCPDFYDIIKEFLLAGSSTTEIDVVGDPDLFAVMIRYLYMEDLPENFDLSTQGIDLLKLADRYGVMELKYSLDAMIVKRSMVTVTNAVEMLLLGDAIACPYLKEAAIHQVTANPTTIVTTSGWEALAKSPELLASVSSESNRSVGDELDPHDLMHLSVRRLKLCLMERELNTDGSKEMLVERLKQYDREEERLIESGMRG